jgi:hypothetical protein
MKNAPMPNIPAPSARPVAPITAYAVELRRGTKLPIQFDGAVDDSEEAQQVARQVFATSPLHFRINRDYVIVRNFEVRGEVGEGFSNYEADDLIRDVRQVTAWIPLTDGTYERAAAAVAIKNAPVVS